MKILIIGGTGTISSAITRQLAASKYLCPSRSTNRGLRIRRLVRPCYQRDGENKNDD